MNLRPLVVLLALFAALALVACGESRQWQGTIEERDGVVYVSNPREGLWQDRDPAPIRFELEQVFGAELEPEEEIIGGVGLRGVTVDGDGNVYVYDLQAHRLFSFAPDGSLRWAVGREGQGPGEFRGAQGIAWDGDATIYVANGGQTRLDSWSTDGKFIESTSLADQNLVAGTLLGFLDATTIAVEGFGRGVNAGGRLGVLDLTRPWSTLADVTIDVASGDLGRNLAFVSMVASGGLVTVGDIDSYELRFYDRNGELTRIVARDFEQMVGYANSGDRGSPYSWLYPAFQLATGHWIAISSWVDVADADADYSQRLAADTLGDRPWHAALDLFDAEGRFLYSIVSEERTHPVGSIAAVGPDGKLYTSVRDPFPQVRRYRVEIDEW